MIAKILDFVLDSAQVAPQPHTFSKSMQQAVGPTAKKKVGMRCSLRSHINEQIIGLRPGTGALRSIVTVSCSYQHRYHCQQTAFHEFEHCASCDMACRFAPVPLVLVVESPQAPWSLARQSRVSCIWLSQNWTVYSRLIFCLFEGDFFFGGGALYAGLWAANTQEPF